MHIHKVTLWSHQVETRGTVGGKTNKGTLKKRRVCRPGSEGGAGGRRDELGWWWWWWWRWLGLVDEGGSVLARAAALGDGHLWLLLQFDVDHWGSLVKRLHHWICAYRLWIFCRSVCCHSNPIPARTLFAGDKAALWQFCEKDTILFALLWCAVHPRQRRGNAPEQLKANQRSFSEGLTETHTSTCRAGSSPGHVRTKLSAKNWFYSQHFSSNRRGSVLFQCKHQIQLFTLPTWIRITQPYFKPNSKTPTRKTQEAARQQLKQRKCDSD